MVPKIEDGNNFGVGIQVIVVVDTTGIDSCFTRGEINTFL